jgi:SAM-dependent methyltransferase
VIAPGRRVLEIGCGAGQGLALLAQAGQSVVGGDYSMALLRGGRRHYGNRVPFVRLTASELPFRAGAFDLILCFEATYYVPDIQRAFGEIARVLAPGGRALFVNANPERPDFIRSPHSTHYHTADEFRRELGRRGLEVTVEGAFPLQVQAAKAARGVTARALVLARVVLKAVGLTPHTLRGRARLKRLVYGRLIEVPPELAPGFAAVAPRHAVAPGPVLGYKVLYVHAGRPG